jgi:hypothetical protein
MHLKPSALPEDLGGIQNLRPVFASAALREPEVIEWRAADLRTRELGLSFPWHKRFSWALRTPRGLVGFPRPILSVSWVFELWPVLLVSMI